MTDLGAGSLFLAVGALYVPRDKWIDKILGWSFCLAGVLFTINGALALIWKVELP